MINTIIKAIFSILLIISTLFAQRETVGFEYNQHSRDIDSLKTKSNIWSMSYRNELPSGTRIAASFGLDYIKLFDNDSATNPMLKSTNQIFVQLEGLQKLYFMYLKGAVQFYSVNGYAIETTGGYSEILHNNIYRIFEFPFGVGITYPIDAFDFYVGLNKVYFYGTNEKEIIINNGGNETSLGSSSRRTFQSELGFGAEAAILYHFSDKLEFELNFIKYEEKDFSVRFSIWGPLKRMIYIN
ncbi:MAG: hypothetical protein MUP82_08055 [Candidatus Marinimicrobia bacterium]|nr:hypothetical protein [Candidatus Neomarinimicrobiota bacterium]